MKPQMILSAALLMLLAGCETLQTPNQRQQAAARQQNAAIHMDEQVRRLRGQIESVEMENARLLQELQALRREISAYSSEMARLDSAMKSLEAKQAGEMAELIRRVESLITKSITSRPQPTARGAGREHVVESGHTLSAIASAYGTTVKAIKEANNLKSDNIYVGQKLFIPE